MAVALSAVSVVTFLVIREFLDRELNASLLNVASIEAGTLTDAPSGAMRFHEWELTPEEAASVRELNRFAQVWNTEGESLLRTQYITTDLPLDTAALQRAGNGNLVMVQQEFQRLPIRSLYYPLERLGQLHHRHVLQVAAPLEGRNRLLRRLGTLLAAITAVATATIFAGGWWLARRAVQPVHEIIDQAEAIEAGTLQQRITAEADSQEYERLVNVLNTMLERLEASFESQRRFTADASHELRSPLTALKGEIEVALRRDRPPEEYRRVLESNLQEVDRLALLADDLLTLARSDAGVMQPRLRTVDLAERVERVLERVRPEAERSGITIQGVSSGDTVGLFDDRLLDRLVWNLVDNAIKYTPRDGHVEVRCRGAGRNVVLEVADTGPGIPRADADRVFDRFYRVDESRTSAAVAGGTGLGLAIVRAVVDAHGGSVHNENRPGGGTLFRVRLPTGGTGRSA